MGLQERLGAQVPAAWVLSLYPAAAEAGGCFVPSRRRQPNFVPAGQGRDPERASIEAARRARAKVRRYCAANRLNRLGTLTYRGSGCHDPRQLRGDVAVFFRGLREGLGGQSLPYLWTVEWHKTSHGQHVHFAVGRYVPRRLIEQCWGRGFVHIKLLGDLPVGAGPVEEARRAAGYLAKYVGKDFDERRVPGLNRYGVAQGYQPRVTRLVGRSADDVLRQACRVMGSQPARTWLSADEQAWQGPPAVWAQWP